MDLDFDYNPDYDLQSVDIAVLASLGTIALDATTHLGSFELGAVTGMDALFVKEAKAAPRIVLTSLRQLVAFSRVSADILIHKSDKDLWSLSKQSDGTLAIQRLFQDDGQPLKG
jgi:hypothetical protein